MVVSCMVWSRMVVSCMVVSCTYNCKPFKMSGPLTVEVSRFIGPYDTPSGCEEVK
jgi:hypothetical protein